MKENLFRIASAIYFFTFVLGCSTTVPDRIEKKPAIRDDGSRQFIDTHNHLHGQYGSHLDMQQIDYEGASRAALVAMNRLGIKKMFIMPPPFPPDHHGRYTFEDLISTLKKYPNRFAFLGGGGTLNVMIQQAVYEGIVRQTLKNKFEKTAMEILSKGAIGFGELTAEHFSMRIGHPYESAPPDHPLFLLLSDIAALHGVPIDLHMEAIPEDMPLQKVKRLESPYNPRFLRANIPPFEKLLAHNRHTKIIWAHVGWCNTGCRTTALCAELLERHSNLYMSYKISRDSMGETRPLEEDFSIKTDWLELIRTYPERFLIGSDQFYVTPKSNVQIGPPQKEKEGTGRLLALLPPDLSHKVGYENAVRIFKLDR